MTLLLILSRAVHFGSCLLLLGCVAIRLLLEPAAPSNAATLRGLPLLSLACLAAAAGSGFLWLWEAIAGMSASTLPEALSPPLFRMVLTQTVPGRIWLVRGLIAAVLFAVLLGSRHRWSRILAAPLAASLVASLAWLGHAGAGGNGSGSFTLAADVCHLLAASVWPGGLLPFALILRRQVNSVRVAHIAVRRFSAASLAAVGLLVASGLVNAYFLVGGLHALLTTAYGRVLCIKLALFAVALSLGAWNLLVYKPRFDASAHARAALATNVWIEVAIGMLIVLAVAVLGTMPSALPR